MVLLNFCPDSNPGTFSLPSKCSLGREDKQITLTPRRITFR